MAPRSETRDTTGTSLPRRVAALERAAPAHGLRRPVGMSSKDLLDLVITHMPTGASAGPDLDAWLGGSLAQVDPHDL